MEPSVVERCRQQLQNQVPLIGAWLRRRAIRSLAKDGSQEAIHALTDAIVYSPHVLLQAEGLPALWRLAERDNRDAQEALCRLAIEHPALNLEVKVVEAGYLPRDESQRLLFYFLTEQWDKYEAL